MTSQKSAHFTNFGVQLQPCVADVEGYLVYRVGFEDLPECKWTDAEAWLAEQVARIEEETRL